MRIFQAPLDRHHWCQKWCCDVRNHLASRKLDWRTPQENLSGETPDISVFRFHFWQEIEFYDPMVKQPHDGWTSGRFLGIAWDSGDRMTYFIESLSPQGRPVILVRSTVRPKGILNVFSNDPSGETSTNDTDDVSIFNNDEASNENLINNGDLNSDENTNDETKNNRDNNDSTNEENIIDQDDARNKIWDNDTFNEEDDSNLHEEVINDIND